MFAASSDAFPSVPPALLVSSELVLSAPVTGYDSELVSSVEPESDPESGESDAVIVDANVVLVAKSVPGDTVGMLDILDVLVLVSYPSEVVDVNAVREELIIRPGSWLGSVSSASLVVPVGSAVSSGRLADVVVVVSFPPQDVSDADGSLGVVVMPSLESYAFIGVVPFLATVNKLSVNASVATDSIAFGD